mmetsp:Transcript_43304/g.134704  ORF Transcript_43304/g.134704 Transcript_43304/m.134704 type:complete len:211 (+) Transcript_43304:641-1273(+)
MRWWVRGQTATSTTACRPPPPAAIPSGSGSCGTGNRRDVGSKPEAQLPPLLPTPLTSKSCPPAAPMSVSLEHQATEGPALGAASPRATTALISQVCVFHKRTRRLLPAWATASVVPSGAHWRPVTGPPVHLRSVTHQGMDCSAERPLCGQTRTIPRAPAAARHLPSGDQVTAGHANAWPCSDQTHNHPSCSERRQTATPNDMPTAKDPRM